MTALTSFLDLSAGILTSISTIVIVVVSLSKKVRGMLFKPVLEKISDTEEKIKTEISTLQENDKKQELSIMRMSLLQLIQHEPENIRLIRQIEGEYLAKGGNSWIVHSVIPKWEKEFDPDCKK